jgi:hypothetical protein
VVRTLSQTPKKHRHSHNEQVVLVLDLSCTQGQFSSRRNCAYLTELPGRRRSELPGRRVFEPGRSVEPGRPDRARCILRPTTMNETRRISHGARRHRNGAGLELRPARFNRLQLSNRQILLVDSGITCCKQTVGIRSNRQNFGHSQTSLFRFPISIFLSLLICGNSEAKVMHTTSWSERCGCGK